MVAHSMRWLHGGYMKLPARVIVRGCQVPGLSRSQWLPSGLHALATSYAYMT
jgi:hypothetical protein